jgi:hypothetical protein
MQLLLTTKRHFTVALWMSVRLSATAPASARMRRSMMRRVEVCVESHGGHFEHSLQNYCFSHNSQIKCLRTHVDVHIVARFGLWDSCPKTVRTFQLHPSSYVLHLCTYLFIYGLVTRRPQSVFWCKSDLFNRYFLPL